LYSVIPVAVANCGSVHHKLRLGSDSALVR